jgi:hypothetical protein
LALLGYSEQILFKEIKLKGAPDSESAA